MLNFDYFNSFKVLSRLVIVPMEEQIMTEIPDIGDDIEKSSGAIGVFIRSAAEICNVDVNKIAKDINKQIPKTCGYRLATNYAILIHLTNSLSSKTYFHYF